MKLLRRLARTMHDCVSDEHQFLDWAKIDPVRAIPEEVIPQIALEQSTSTFGILKRMALLFDYDANRLVCNRHGARQLPDQPECRRSLLQVLGEEIGEEDLPGRHEPDGCGFHERTMKLEIRIGEPRGIRLLDLVLRGASRSS
jgi:hypothetical protein